RWTDKLGKPELCTNCKPFIKTKNVIVAPNYGSLFNNQIFSKALTNKLKYILANSNITSNYYVRIGNVVEKPTFRNEKEYNNMLYPDAGYRLLALYRYWNMIQYFFPSRHLITEDWNKVLPTSIYEYVNAKNKTDYAVATAKLISTIHDSHAFIQSAVLEDFEGRYCVPFQAKFIEDKLVVTDYYKDTLNVKEKFKTGDIITAINGTLVKDLMRKYLPLTSASNYTTQLRDLPGAYLLRSNNPKFSFSIIRNNQFLKVDAAAAETYKINVYQKDWNPNARTPGYCLINSQIGYLVAGNYKNSDLNDIKKTFAGTKGIIVDLRCYPSDVLENTFGNYIKPFSSVFVRYTVGSVRNPGSFKLFSTYKNGEKTGDNYQGKVVVIVNEITQSNAEFVTMAFQSGPNVKVIGSTTSGADGNISEIKLPGGITTYISGIGVFYPDRTKTQRTGVKIDYVIKPTIQGIKAGRDELLEKAQELILK
ncbi:MAG TPA: S41 family peptidase, partial [Segetibacter sp.]